MTNNTAPQTTTDLGRLIAFLEKQLFDRQAVIDLHNRQLARWAHDPEMVDRLPDCKAQVEAEKARFDGINLALQEAKAIAEGY